MNGRDLPHGSLEERKAKVSGKGLNLYFTEGFSAKFMVHLERFSMWIWKRYCYTVDFEEFYDEVVFRLCERLQANLYDSNKASFVTYIFSMARNIATSLNSKDKRIVQEETDFDRVESSCSDIDGEFLDWVVAYSKNRGVVIDRVALEHDVVNCVSSPLVEVVTWLWCRRVYEEAT